MMFRHERCPTNKRRCAAVLGLVCLLVAGCDEGVGPARGSLGAACLSGGVCEAGLICSADNICVQAGAQDMGPVVDWLRPPIPDGGPEGPDAAPDSGGPPPSPWLARLKSPGNPVLHAAGVASQGSALLLVGDRAPSLVSGRDLVLAKLEHSGTPVWSKTLDGGAQDTASLVVPAGSDGFLVAATSAGSLWLLRVESDGSVKWQRRYQESGAANTGIDALLPLADGGFLLLGPSHASSSGNDQLDVLVVKIDEGGAVSWARRLAGTGYHRVQAAAEMAAGGSVLVGYHRPTGSTNQALMVVRLAADGQVEWSRRFDGPGQDSGGAVVELPGEGMAVAGSTTSWGAGGSDLWLLQLSADGLPVAQSVHGGPKAESARGLQRVPGGLLFLGFTSSFGATGADMLVGKWSTDGTLQWQKRIQQAGYNYPVGSALLVGNGLAVLTAADDSAGDDIWAVAAVGPDGATPPGCAAISTTQLASATTQVQPSTLTLSATSAEFTSSTINASGSSGGLSLATQCP